MKRTSVGTGIWFAWMLASAVGWAVAFPIKGDLVWPWGWLISGTLAGVLQAILLRRCTESSTAWKWWGVASTIGWMGACLVIGTVSIDTTDVKTLTTMLVAGIPAGILQWLTLQRTLRQTPREHIATLATWIVANVLGIGMAVTTVIMLDGASGYIDSLTAQVLIGGLFGMVQGAITGGVLTWQLGWDISPSASPTSTVGS